MSRHKLGKGIGGIIMASLSLKNIQKVYPNGFHAVKDFNLEIEDKEFKIDLKKCIKLI